MSTLLAPARVIYFRFKFYFLACLLGCSPLAFSAPVFFDDQTAFLSALDKDISLSYNSFELADPFGQRVGGGRSEVALDGLEISSPLHAIKLMSRAYSGNHNVTPGGSKYLSFDTDLRRRGALFTFSFDRPIDALGFYLIDHDASDASISWVGGSYRFPEVNDAEAVFWGVQFDKPQQEVVLDSMRDSQVSIDDLSFGVAGAVITVTEPGSSCLLVLALFGLFRLHRSA